MGTLVETNFLVENINGMYIKLNTERLLAGKGNFEETYLKKLEFLYSFGEKDRRKTFGI